MNSTLPYFVFISWVFSKIAREKYSKFYVVDSTTLPVCNNNHRFNSKIFKGLAGSGKNMDGWFFGFKLHIIINDNMDIVSLKITKGGHNDLAALDENFIKDISGWLVGDKGYIGKKKAEELNKKGIKLLTKSRANMTKYPATKEQLYLLSRRQIVESVFGSVKYRLSAINKYVNQEINSAKKPIFSCFSSI